ncbi:MAG: tetratricopeptide repeat protein, partial [Bacteroidia bacterium]
MRLTSLFLGAFLLLFCGQLAVAQTTVIESDNTAAFNKAHDLFHKQKYAAAQSAFLRYINGANNAQLVSDARYYISVCAAELMLNNTVEKTLMFRDADPINTRNAKSKFTLGQYYFRLKNYHAALFEFIQIEPLVSLNPYENEAYYFMTGYCQFVEGNLNEARAYFDEIKDYQNEYYHLANYFAAYVSFQNKEYDKALKGFKRIHKHNNFKDFVPIYIAEVYAYNKQYDLVISYGDSILQNNALQKKHVVHLLLAQAYFKKQDFKQAVKYYSKYADLRTLGTEDSYQYGYACYVLKDYNTAQKQFKSFVIDQDSLGQNVSYLLADTYVKNKLKNEARNSFLFASRLDFNKLIKEDAFYNYAKLSHELKFNKAAMNAFNEFIKTYPNSQYADEAKVNYTRILLSSNDNLKALELIEEIPNPNKKIQGGYQRLAFNVGLEYLDIQNFEKAREYLNKSLKKPVIGE